MKTIFKGTYKNITIVVKVDKENDTYINKVGIEIQQNEIDEYFCCRESLYLINGKIGSRKKHIETIALKAVSRKELLQYRQNDIDFVNKNVSKLTTSRSILFKNLIN